MVGAPVFASTIAATMTPCRLPLRPDTPTSHRTSPSLGRGPSGAAGWTRKAFAIALHLSCLALFGLTVVWPVASPLASGELAREFKPVLEALANWSR